MARQYPNALTREEARRAIYIDFEGGEDKPPSLVGAGWDKQMRTNHQIEDKETQKPLIDINVMAALPRMDEMKRRQEEQEAVEAEAA